MWGVWCRGAVVSALSLLLAGSGFAQEPDFAAAGRELFVKGVSGQVNCALCHTLADAGASGAIGPNLNELRPKADEVEKAMREGLGPMPAFTWLSEQQIGLLARYVEWASRRQP